MDDPSEEARDHCECVISRHDARRCELWMLNGIAHLRLCEGHDLVHEEPAVRGELWQRSTRLRTGQG